MYGDTAAIRARAHRMRERAHAIRSDARALLAGAETVPWQGLAAEAMRRLARDHVNDLHRCAAAHEEAADALDRHARDVDHVKELIADVEHRVLGILHAATGDVAGMVGHVLPDALEPWTGDWAHDWARDFVPPPHGSLAWLDVHVPRPS
jgi:uncharacterized protein YukE